MKSFVRRHYSEVPLVRHAKGFIDRLMSIPDICELPLFINLIAAFSMLLSVLQKLFFCFEIYNTKEK